MTVPTVSPSIVAAVANLASLSEILRGPDGPNEVGIKALAGAHGDDVREFHVQGLRWLYGLPRCVRKRNGEVAAFGRRGRCTWRNSSSTGTNHRGIRREIHVVLIDPPAAGANFELVAAKFEMPVARLRILVEIRAQPASPARCAGAGAPAPAA